MRLIVFVPRTVMSALESPLTSMADSWECFRLMSSIVMFAVASSEVLIVMVLSEATLESRLVKVGSLSPMVLLFWETV